MIRGIYTNAGAMHSLQLKQEVTANNLANSTTTGFKKDGVFRKHLVDHATILRQNSTDFKNLQDVDEVGTDFSQGSLIPTGNQFDVALDGRGFFTVETPNGFAYTRNGNFNIDQNGFVSTLSGYRVMGTTGPVQIAGNEVIFGEDGSINVDGAIAGFLRIADFQDLGELNKLGDGLFDAAQGAEQQADLTQVTVRAGFLEESNVEVVQSMVEIIQISRDFDSNQKSITMQDQTVDKAVNEIGRLR